MQNRHQRGTQHGFSIIETMVVLVIFTVVMAIVLSQMTNLQKASRAEASKLDNTQEGREFLDQLVRDLHQSGYPSARMFSKGVLSNPPQNDSRSAAGLILLSQTDLWFEGDLDGDGQVESVRYTLISDPSNPGNCPCFIQRSQTSKVNGTPPMNQTVTYLKGIGGVVNSVGMGGSGTGGSLPIAGTTVLSGGRAVATDVFYAGYKSQAIFSAFDQDGNSVTLPVDISSNPTAIANIRTVRITINTIGNNADLQDGSKPAVSVNATARLFN